ncbi:unnamed protein product [Rhizoctonia solani]|uniref:Uncharacterized protein n=1 Tax=Rhizoctonia solani TaxID=456999 RepID=A0A8H3D5P5_9AGAM|nr:unnamed protein product [Rhizoctonia solani]
MPAIDLPTCVPVIETVPWKKVGGHMTTSGIWGLSMRGSFLAASLALYSNLSAASRGERRQNNNEIWSGPLADGGNAWKDAHAKAKQVVSQMTLEEKGVLCSSQTLPRC